ncbi:hypothetical protein [uncultured Clostridium sp.]|uniref:hypothetical protein n=1 Tax=uncultured Clostridium sp. TaxID=59620 RepID=UPI00262DC911|nr:hypothetical protein [uncultured Clostridium sp.]
MNETILEKIRRTDLAIEYMNDEIEDRYGSNIDEWKEKYGEEIKKHREEREKLLELLDNERKIENFKTEIYKRIGFIGVVEHEPEDYSSSNIIKDPEFASGRSNGEIDTLKFMYFAEGDRYKVDNGFGVIKTERIIEEGIFHTIYLFDKKPSYSEYIIAYELYNNWNSYESRVSRGFICNACKKRHFIYEYESSIKDCIDNFLQLYGYYIKGECVDKLLGSEQRKLDIEFCENILTMCRSIKRENLTIEKLKEKILDVMNSFNVNFEIEIENCDLSIETEFNEIWIQLEENDLLYKVKNAMIDNLCWK